MNLTMNSTIIELSVHACNFVVEVLHREEPGARVWPKLMLKLHPKIAIFQNFIIFTCLLGLLPKMFTSVTQLRKSVVKKLAYYGLVNFRTNTSCPSKAMQNVILSIIHHMINTPNC